MRIENHKDFIMQWKVIQKSKYIIAFMVLTGIPWAVSHYRDWDSEKITAVCEPDQTATSIAFKRDIVEKRIIPERDVSPDFTVWSCPDGKVRVTKNKLMVDAQGLVMKAPKSP